MGACIIELCQQVELIWMFQKDMEMYSLLESYF